MKVPKHIQVKMIKASGRDIELVNGRVNHNRIHKNKKAYNRTNNKQIMKKEFTGLTM